MYVCSKRREGDDVKNLMGVCVGRACVFSLSLMDVIYQKHGREIVCLWVGWFVQVGRG